VFVVGVVCVFWELALHVLSQTSDEHGVPSSTSESGLGTRAQWHCLDETTDAWVLVRPTYEGQACRSKLKQQLRRRLCETHKHVLKSHDFHMTLHCTASTASHCFHFCGAKPIHVIWRAACASVDHGIRWEFPVTGILCATSSCDGRGQRTGLLSH